MVDVIPENKNDIEIECNLRVVITVFLKGYTIWLGNGSMYRWTICPPKYDEEKKMMAIFEQQRLTNITYRRHGMVKMTCKLYMLIHQKTKNDILSYNSNKYLNQIKEFVIRDYIYMYYALRVSDLNIPMDVIIHIITIN